jgi:hypothetical protein
MERLWQARLACHVATFKLTPISGVEACEPGPKVSVPDPLRKLNLVELGSRCVPQEA